MMTAIGAYNVFKVKAAKDAFKVMSNNAAVSADEYFMDHINEATVGASVSIQDLVDGSYLEKTRDPFNQEGVCTGTVKIIDISGTGKAKLYKYSVYLKCSKNMESCKEYPGGTASNSCTSGVESTFGEGNYVQVGTDVNSSSIAASMTGYTSDQTINPSELKLWRVIKKNSNGSVDAISEYTSSTPVFFSSTRGYANLVGGLQAIASKYEIPGVTTSTRIPGYDGQTLTISDTSLFDGSKSPSIDIDASPTPTSGTGEELSGGVLGDTLYLKDYQLINNTYGTLSTQKVGTTSNKNYYFASRVVFKFLANGQAQQNLLIFSPRTSGNLSNPYVPEFLISSNRVYDFNKSEWTDGKSSTTQIFIRPIITINGSVAPKGGEGSKDNPFIIE